MAGRTVSSHSSSSHESTSAEHSQQRGRSARSSAHTTSTSTRQSSSTRVTRSSRSSASTQHTPRVTRSHRDDTVQTGHVQRTVSATGEHRIVLPDGEPATTRRAPRRSAGNIVQRMRKNIAQRVQRARSRNDIRRPRIVENETGVSKPGAFVDANNLQSRDIVARTLQETAGRIGIATRPKIVDFSERQKERHSARVRQIIVHTSIAIAAIAAVIMIVWLLFFSPMLRLREENITQSGANAWVSDAQIMNITKKQAGKSLLLVSDGQVQEALSQIPGVSSAKVSKKFPNGLHVDVVSQRPAAMLQAPDSDTMTAVDNRGRILNAVKDTSTKGIPVIQVDNVNKSLERRAVKTALTILDALPENWRTSITRVQANTQDSITTTLNNGITIVWGDSSELKLKKAIVDKIMNDPKVIGDKKQINVSAPARPIIK